VLRLFTLVFCLLVPFSAHSNDRLITLMTQASLSQDITKTSCFIASHFGTRRQLDHLSEALKSYDDTLVNQAAPPQPNKLWRLHKFAALLILDMPKVTELELDLMNKFDQAWVQQHEALIAQQLKQPNDNPAYQATLHALLQVDYLLQKTTKTYCLLTSEWDKRANMTRLKQDMSRLDQLFDNVLNGDLDNNIMAPPTDQLRSKIENLQGYWQSLHEKFDKFTHVESAHNRDIQLVSELSQPLSTLSQDITQLFITAYEDYKSNSIILTKDTEQ